MKLILGALLATLACPMALAERYPFSGCFDLASRQYNIEMDLLLAVASVESNWNPDARSTANAHGVMQIRWPLTAKHLGTRRVAELYNPCLNINLGARYLRELFDNYDQDTQLALAAYNYGPTRIQSHRDIPDSVQDYVNKVNRQRVEISNEMNHAVQGNFKAHEFIEIIRFNSPIRARRYLASLQQRIPGLKLIIEQRHGENAIVLDPLSLTSDARYRLNTLVPDFKQRTHQRGNTR